MRDIFSQRLKVAVRRQLGEEWFDNRDQLVDGPTSAVGLGVACQMPAWLLGGIIAVVSNLGEKDQIDPRMKLKPGAVSRLWLMV